MSDRPTNSAPRQLAGTRRRAYEVSDNGGRSASSRGRRRIMMASQLSRAPLLDERDAQAIGAASSHVGVVPVSSSSASSSSRMYQIQLGGSQADCAAAGASSSSSHFPPCPPSAISHKYWDAKQPPQQAEARALAFLRKLDRHCCNLTFKEDVTFIVEGNDQISAHRFILASKSPVFRKMFETHMKETRTGEIQILDASGPAIRGMVDYCYSAEIIFADQVFPEEVLKVAHKYDLPELKCEAECELLKRLTEVNLVEALELSCTYQAEIVKKRCIDYLSHSIRVNSHNLCSLLRISYKYDVAPLKVRVLEYFRQNFESLKFVVMDDLLSS